MSINEIMTILFVHWVGDFVLQTDYQAKNKSTFHHALAGHVLVYSLFWMLFVMLWTSDPVSAAKFAAVTFMCHYITDYFTSRLNKKLWTAGKVHYFFVSVGFDQILHYAQLFITFKLFLC